MKIRGISDLFVALLVELVVATRRFAVVLPLIFPHVAPAQNKTSAQVPATNAVTLTGILLVSDRRCDERPATAPKDIWMCPEGSTDWGLITRTKQYLVWGNTSELRKYERRRVSVIGRVSPGSRQSFMDRLDVDSIVPSEIPEAQIEDLVGRLRGNEWIEPVNESNPTSWSFHFTPPMLQILQAGSAAQDILLKYLDDPEMKDQIIILLGGIGNQRAVEPIIHAMVCRDEARESRYARKINLAADLALTNITAADVIWHHGGGITRDACPDDPKSCWYSWWLSHRDAFDIAKTPSRNYSNYPSYGIYQDPGLFRSDSFR